MAIEIDVRCGFDLFSVGEIKAGEEGFTIFKAVGGHINSAAKARHKGIAYSQDGVVMFNFWFRGKGGVAERKNGIVLAAQKSAIGAWPAVPFAPTGIARQADCTWDIAGANAKVLANSAHIGWIIGVG